MGRFFGGVFGSTKSVTDTIINSANVSGRYTMLDQYYSRSQNQWRVVPPGDQANPITTGPSDFWASGYAVDGNSYWWANVGSATVHAPKQYEFVRHDSKSWVKITDEDFSSATESNVNSNFNYTGTGMASNPYGWKQYDNKWYWCAIPASRDTEGWNDWDLGSISFRYWRATMYWIPMSSGNSIPSGHPDNDNPGNFRAQDSDFNSRSYGGGSNISWHRFGIGNVQHMAHSDLGFSGERTSVKGNIYTGDKSGEYASGVSRIGSGATGYWDLGSNSANRIFRTSAGDESGAGGSEQHAWSPHEMWLSDG